MAPAYANLAGAFGAAIAKRIVRRTAIRIGLAIAVSPGLSGCAGAVAPNITRASNSIGYVPSLQAVACNADELGTPLPDDFVNVNYVPQTGKELGGLAAVHVTSLVGKGVDVLGQKLTARGKEKTRTLEAQLNIDDVAMKVGCFQLVRQDGLLVRFALPQAFGSWGEGRRLRSTPRSCRSRSSS